VRSDSPNGAFFDLSLRLNDDPMTTYGRTTALATTRWARVVVPLAQLPAGPPTRFMFMIYVGGAGRLWVVDASLMQRPSMGVPVLVLAPRAAVAVPRTYFCMNVFNMNRNWVSRPLYDWPAVDFGTWRTWITGSGMVWADLEPTKGCFDWRKMDAGMAKAEQRGIKVLHTLGISPTWASSNPTGQGPYYGPGQTWPPRNLADWTDYVRAVARRYKGRSAAYGAWGVHLSHMFRSYMMCHPTAHSISAVASCFPPVEVCRRCWPALCPLLTDLL
jgi:hypothetical protein